MFISLVLIEILNLTSLVLRFLVINPSTLLKLRFKNFTHIFEILAIFYMCICTLHGNVGLS